MSQTRYPTRYLATKLTFVITTVLVVVVAGVSWLSIYRTRKAFQTELEYQAEMMLDVMVSAASDAFYLRDYDELKYLMTKLSRELDAGLLVAGKAYQADGRVVSDAHLEGIQIQSLQSDPFGVRLMQGEQTVFEWQADTLLAGKSVVVGGETLGALSIGLSTHLLQDKLAAIRNQGIVLALVAAGLGIALARLLSRSITEPLRLVTEATQRLTAGDLSRTIQVQSNDETAVLAEAFNTMTLRLRTLIAQMELQAQELRQSEAQASEKAVALEQTLHELQRTQIQLVHSEKMASLGQLVAGIAHEINNPTSFIAGNIQPAQSYAEGLLALLALYQGHYPQPAVEIQQKIAEIELAFVSEDFPRLLRSMQVGAARIAEIVRSLRIFSRKDSDSLKTADIHEGLDSTLLILRNRLKQQSNRPAIEVVRDYGDLPPVTCYCGQLNQVFMNILANAIDALEESLAQPKADNGLLERQTASPAVPVLLAPRGPNPKIQIQTQLLKPGWVSISIADNGPGMPETVRQKLFDPFFTTKDVGKGTGLGLSISYQIIVEQHQGQLSCTSTAAGTVFVIELPIVPPQTLADLPTSA
ncbi:MAG: sensor histidine kinase [Almyronema sp.]